ncbi:hypothetical protein FOZ62_028389 [Perkinsus olseni]|uniref:Gamma-glutamylcyclotransferase AIG2-like domain-containing protein n=2 Tax=Perkinsus olseni TaxID=32597 RepID=A0A7J6TEM1_PEROL|nr:hypothetical protein FOZ62_028389 [Perkinsus olseni]
MIHIFDHALGFREPIPAGDGEVPVFSFGANMSLASLKSRGVPVSDDREPIRATLDDHELAFNLAPVHIAAYEGHYGNVRLKQGAKVHGVVVWFPPAGLRELDTREGPSYDRRWTQVTPYATSAAEPIKVMIYVQTQSFPGVSVLKDGLPGRRYLMTLVTGADRAGLLPEWIEHLRSLPYRPYEQFDWDDEDYKRELLQREYTADEIIASHVSRDPLLVSILGVVILLPTSLEPAELNVFEDLTLATATRVAYEPPPKDALALTAEQRGFVGSILCSLARFPGARIMGHLPSYCEFWPTLTQYSSCL